MTKTILTVFFSETRCNLATGVGGYKSWGWKWGQTVAIFRQIGQLQLFDSVDRICLKVSFCLLMTIFSLKLCILEANDPTRKNFPTS